MKRTARIFRPAKSATQSGLGRTRRWILAFEPAERREIDPLTGEIGSSDAQSWVRLTFDSRDAAVAYARSEGLECTVEEPNSPRFVPKSYADNFAFGRPS